MAKITYINASGVEQILDVPPGQSLMQAAVLNNIDGIEAECGGSCSCATCHVYLHPDAMQVFPSPDELEDELLEGVASPRKAGSRLSCQLVVEADTQDLSVCIPEAQY